MCYRIAVVMHLSELILVRKTRQIFFDIVSEANGTLWRH